MVNKFKCAEPNCPNEVVYIAIPPVSATGELARRDYDATTSKGTPKRVYLECALGHSHPYVVVV